MYYIVRMTKRAKQPPIQTWRPTVEDKRLMEELAHKFGIKEVDILRMGLRRLAEEQKISRG